MFQKSEIWSEEQEVRFTTVGETIGKLINYSFDGKEYYLHMPKPTACYLGPNFSKNFDEFFVNSNSVGKAKTDYGILKKTGMMLIQTRPSDTEFSIVPSNGVDQLLI